MMSMTADVCDLDELATGKRREGIFGAIYWWMVKLGFAVAGLLSGAIMSLVAFTPGAAVQPEGAVDGLRLFYSGVPIFGTLLAMWIMRNYDLDETRATGGSRRARAAQAARRCVVVPGLGRPAVAGRAWPAPAGDAERHRWRARPPAEISALYTEQLRSGVYGLCFSAYTEGPGRGRPADRGAGAPARRAHCAAHALGAVVRLQRGP